MGYTTDFTGEFKITPALKPEDRRFLLKLAETRRMARNLDPKYGVEGEWYVDGNGYYGQDGEANIINHNQPPSTQPSLWLQWVPNEDGTAYSWDGGEKFYNYIEWLEYLTKNYFEPRGYHLNGRVKWQGEDLDDTGTITLTNNIIAVGS